MAAGENIEFVARIDCTALAMSFAGSSYGKAAASWQQFEIETRRCQVNDAVKCPNFP